MRGNNVAVGYYRDDEMTAAAFRDGWFHSGDLGVMHPDGYVEIRDRLKDMIISGGENISSIEVEHALAGHPDLVEVAVVGVPDDLWGEVPKAYAVARERRRAARSTTCASSPAGGWRGTSCRRRSSSSTRCRRRPPARCRSTSCAIGRGRRRRPGWPGERPRPLRPERTGRDRHGRRHRHRPADGRRAGRARRERRPVRARRGALRAGCRRPRAGTRRSLPRRSLRRLLRRRRRPAGDRDAPTLRPHRHPREQRRDGLGRPVEDTPLRGWQKVVDVNLTGVFLCTPGRRAGDDRAGRRQDREHRVDHRPARLAAGAARRDRLQHDQGRGGRVHPRPGRGSGRGTGSP